MRLRTVLAGAGLLVMGAAGWLAWRIGPSNIVGMLLYDQRREGTLQPGDPAPDVALTALDGGEVRLSEHVGEKPLVLIFGSFT